MFFEIDLELVVRPMENFVCKLSKFMLIDANSSNFPINVRYDPLEVIYAVCTGKLTFLTYVFLLVGKKC